MVFSQESLERSLIMNQGQTIFSQVIDFLPKKKFRQCVNRYNPQRCIKFESFTTL